MGARDAPLLYYMVQESTRMLQRFSYLLESSRAIGATRPALCAIRSSKCTPAEAQAEHVSVLFQCLLRHRGGSRMLSELGHFAWRTAQQILEVILALGAE